MEVSIYDCKKRRFDSLIGSVTIQFSTLLSSGFDAWFGLEHKGRTVGKVRFSAYFEELKSQVASKKDEEEEKRMD